MVAVADRPPSETTETGDIEALLTIDAAGLSDAELVDRLLAALRMRARLDATVVALTDCFDARTVWAADGARNAPGWVTARVGVSYAQAKVDLALARNLRGHCHIRAAHAAGRLTRDQVRALLAARAPGLEEVFDLCEEVLVEEVAAATLAAGRRFLARWVQQVRERFGIGEPDGPEPGSRGGRSRVWLSPVGDRWAGELNLSAEDGEKIAAAVSHQIDALWHDGVFTADDGLDASERRAIALVEVIERGTRGGDDDGTARPLIFALTTPATLRQPPAHAPRPEPTDQAHHHNGNGTGNGTGSEGCDRSPATAPGDDAPADTRADHCPDPTGPNEPTGEPDPTADDIDHIDCAGRDGARPAPTGPEGTAGTRTPPPSWLLPLDGTAPGPGGDSWSGPGDLDVDPFPGDLFPDDLLGGLDPLMPYLAMLSELSRSGPVHPDVVRRLACEGTVVPVYVGPGADQLNMGRGIRIANRAQRRALRIRDGGCVFPGCSVAPEYCVAHHLVWWEHGGRTDLINLALVCRHHHKAVHGGGFTMTRGPDGTIVTARTDREPLTAPLRARNPLIRTRPPPGAPPTGAPPTGAPPTDDDGEIAAERKAADYLARCRIKDLIRQAETARHCRRRDPSDTTALHH